MQAERRDRIPTPRCTYLCNLTSNPTPFSLSFLPLTASATHSMNPRYHSLFHPSGAANSIAPTVQLC